MIGGQEGFFVLGIDYVVEVVIGFFMKYGDGGVDFLLLIGLMKCQGRILLKELGVLECLYLKELIVDLFDEKL